MQLDMHYYGTYAIARSAGLTPEVAQTIATSAQFVDDNIARSYVTFKDGARIDQEATAHHPINIANLAAQDQRRVWVPFHFMPGNIGTTYTERLKCRMDSPVVQEMRDYHLTFSDRAFAPHLMGIAAHVYADTFSHYGFAGVSSRGNKVENDSFRFNEDVDDTIEHLTPDMRTYITEKEKEFRDSHGGLLTNLLSWLGEAASGALGHGSVATFPDRPYLVWSFEYERPDEVAGGLHSTRNNPATYLAGCRALHGMFRRFAQSQPDTYSNGDDRDFETIGPAVREVLLVQAKKEGRIDAWQAASQADSIFGEPGETIPKYDGESWNEQWEQLDDCKDSGEAERWPVWRFYQAAALHRTYVLRDLLPKRGLIVN